MCHWRRQKEKNVQPWALPLCVKQDIQCKINQYIRIKHFNFHILLTLSSPMILEDLEYSIWVVWTTLFLWVFLTVFGACSTHSLLCSLKILQQRKESNRFGGTRWVNNDRILIIWVNYSCNSFELNCLPYSRDTSPWRLSDPPDDSNSYTDCNVIYMFIGLPTDATLNPKESFRWLDTDDSQNSSTIRSFRLVKHETNYP